MYHLFEDFLLVDLLLLSLQSEFAKRLCEFSTVKAFRPFHLLNIPCELAEPDPCGRCVPILHLLKDALLHGTVPLIDPGLEAFVRRGKFLEVILHLRLGVFRRVVYAGQRHIGVVHLCPLEVLRPDFFLLAVLRQLEEGQICGDLRC